MTSNDQKNGPNYNQQGDQFAGGFAENVDEDQIGGSIHQNTDSQVNLLTIYKQELEPLLNQLEQSNPQATVPEKAQYLQLMIPLHAENEFSAPSKQAVLPHSKKSHTAPS